MKKDDLLDLYSDYLIASFGQITATGLSSLVDNAVSHDQVTRFLSKNALTSEKLWALLKPKVREIERDDGVLVFDDTIQEKAYSQENDIISWHFDHTKGCAVKGINLLNCVYSAGDVSLPVAFEIIKKSIRFTEIATRKEKRKSPATKNEQLRTMLDLCQQNQLKWQYVLADRWFSSSDNMKYIHQKLGKSFIFGLKGNRLVALNPEDKKQGRYVRVDSIKWSEQPIQGWIKGLDFPVLLYQQVFKNKDGSTGALYLISNAINLTATTIEALYKKRWCVEVFHKNIKSNTGLAKSPTHTVRTQSNHIFISLYSAAKLQCLSIKQKLNTFALKHKLYANAIQHAFSELRSLQAACA